MYMLLIGFSFVTHALHVIQVETASRISACWLYVHHIYIGEGIDIDCIHNGHATFYMLYCITQNTTTYVQKAAIN
jgi:hypothetical protein